MKIIIPMAGQGKRYSEGHFFSPKPLLDIDGRTMIEHVIDMFPRDSDFIFLCNKNHLENTPLREILMRASPNGRIILIGKEHLEGPASSCIPILDDLDDKEEIIVNYCDFIQTWDYDNFIKEAHNKKADGAITSFVGFHPSSLGDTYYCYMKTNDEGYITDIREKKSFSKNKMDDYASTGTYYFANGRIFKRYLREILSDESNKVNGEYYMSLPYIPMLKDKLKVLNYPIEKFICFGAPRDYELYKFWSEFFLKYSLNFITFNNINVKTINIFPLAGGERDFFEIGLNSLNFMVETMNKPLIYYALKSCPKGVKNFFITLEENKKEFGLSMLPKDLQYLSEFIFLKEKRASNAATVLETKNKIPKDHPVCVSGCTYILDYDERRMSHLMEDEDIDVILFSFSHHECILRHPLNIHYAKINKSGFVEKVVGKNQTLSDNPYKDQALTGTAIYKLAEDLFSSIEEYIEEKKEKNPFFLSAVNNLIKKGKKVVIFEVNKFIPIRSVTNYLEFIYWQDFFDKSNYHPYSKMIQ